MKTLALIHTISNYHELIFKPFAEPFIKKHPDIRIFNIMDDSLLKHTIETGECGTPILRRIYNYVISANELGAECVMITCTSVNRASRILRPLSPIPLFNIDEPNVEQAVQAARRIGILATLKTSPPATVESLNAEAERQGKKIIIETKVVDGAFDVLSEGNRALHDEMVCEALYKMTKQVDAVCFAQVSMGMLKHDPCDVPLFKIGVSGFERAAQILEG